MNRYSYQINEFSQAIDVINKCSNKTKYSEALFNAYQLCSFAIQTLQHNNIEPDIMNVIDDFRELIDISSLDVTNGNIPLPQIVINRFDDSKQQYFINLINKLHGLFIRYN